MLGSSNSRIRRGAFGAVVLALLVAACGSAGTDTSSAPQSDTTSAPQSDVTTSSQTERAAPTTAASRPALLANTVDGNQVDVSALVGQDALLWFWAPW